MTFPLRRTAVTTAAGCMALAMASPALATAAPVAHPAKPAAKTQTIKSGQTSLAIGKDAVTLELTDGFTLAAVKPAKLNTTTLTTTFPVTGGKVNVTKLTGTLKQTGGISIAKGGTTIVIKNAVANLATRTATATVTGKGKGFNALKLGKPTGTTSKGKTATISGYTVTLSKKAIAYLDKTFKTTVFKKTNQLGTGTTKLTFKK
jgi:hypothetical protein